jgi:hypothetical protein
MAQIEHRQARIRRIRALNVASKKAEDKVAIDLNAHYTIGKSQNDPKHMGLFIQENSGDPAVKVRVFVESSMRYVSP